MAWYDFDWYVMVLSGMVWLGMVSKYGMVRCSISVALFVCNIFDMMFNLYIVCYAIVFDLYIRSTRALYLSHGVVGGSSHVR